MDTILEVKGLARQFKKVTAVAGVDFSVARGEIFGFLGPNGAGKSKTIKMLTTLIDPTAGEATLDGKSIHKDKTAVRGRLGIVFQDQSLDDKLTAVENLKFHGWLYGMSNSLIQSRTKELLQLVELSDRKDDLVATYSGGMKRRLEIARALLHHPKILFLDEPTQGLDPQTRTKMWEYLRGLKMREGLTIFLTTHYMDEAEYCDRIAIIDHGKIIARGTPAELKAETGQPTLNQVFLSLTGRDMRDEVATPEPQKNPFFK